MEVSIFDLVLMATTFISVWEHSIASVDSCVIVTFWTRSTSPIFVISAYDQCNVEHATVRCLVVSQ